VVSALAGIDVFAGLFYMSGELGIRHEETVAVTENGCENLAPRWSGTPKEPAMVWGAVHLDASSAVRA
jgi:hypothetical protein